MRAKVPKIMLSIFYVQLVLALLSCLILVTASGFNGLYALFTIVPILILSPVMIILTIIFPYKQWSQYGSAKHVIAMVFNVPILIIALTHPY
jgi:hypothetical protein